MSALPPSSPVSHAVPSVSVAVERLVLQVWRRLACGHAGPPCRSTA